MPHHGLVTEARSAGVTDPRVLQALTDVPRRRFVPSGFEHLADVDAPVPIACGQTTSQPSLIALMVEALELGPEARVLEIGTGLGYQAAILATLAAHVWTIEWWPALAAQAEENLSSIGARNVSVVVGDGRAGLLEHAPFDGIVVAARADEVPPALIAQLSRHGRLVIPVGPPGAEHCAVLTRSDSGDPRLIRSMGPVRFVPLLHDEVSDGLD
jgi:protein-L-isoaspartate(D-aspartate) O-methyltransferase